MSHKQPSVLTKRTKRSGIDIASLSLGCPIGLTQGTINQYEVHADSATQAQLAFCCCCYAYAYTYVRSPRLWTPQCLNQIIATGGDLLRYAAAALADDQLDDEHIVQQPFICDSYRIQLASNADERVLGHLIAPNGRSIHADLQQFFRRPTNAAHVRRRGCLFRCDACILLIWRADRAYYVFDAAGRNQRCELDACGQASLVCLEKLTNVVCLLLRYSGLRPSGLYALSELRVVKLLRARAGEADAAATVAPAPLPVARPKAASPDPLTTLGYVQLDAHSAILHGTLSLGSACFEATRNRHALPVACIAYIYSLVRPPNAWSARSVDKVLLLGSQLYAEAVAPQYLSAGGASPTGPAGPHFELRHIPPVVSLGSMRAQLSVHPYVQGGRLTHTVDTRTGELQLALRRFFDDEKQQAAGGGPRQPRCALLQADAVTLVVWCRAGVYYLFDAYARNAAGGVVVCARGSAGAACVRMFATLDKLGEQLYENLMSVAEKQLFYVHGVAAQVAPTDHFAGPGAPAAAAAATSTNATATDAGGDSEDVRSLNESIQSGFVERFAAASACRTRTRWSVPPAESGGAGGCDECDLDDPALSATQFMKPWDAVKAEVFAQLLEPAKDPCARSSGALAEDDGLSQLDLGDGGGDDDDTADCDNNDMMMPNEEYEALQKAGVSDDTMRAYANFRLTPAQMLDWAAAGVQPDDLERLYACGCKEAEDWKQYKRWGLSVEDVCNAHCMELVPRTYAKLKKAGVQPDMMRVHLENAENVRQFRALGLNKCQIEKLSEAGISVEAYAAASIEGLSYEEVLHAKRNNIDPTDFARMKDMGMSSVDIVRSKELGLDPDQYMQLSDLGLQLDEMRRLSASGVTPDEFLALRALGLAGEAELRAYAERKAADPQLTPDGFKLVAEAMAAERGGQQVTNVLDVQPAVNGRAVADQPSANSDALSAVDAEVARLSAAVIEQPALLNADGTPNLQYCELNEDGTPVLNANGEPVPNERFEKLQEQRDAQLAAVAEAKGKQATLQATVAEEQAKADEMAKAAEQAKAAELAKAAEQAKAIAAPHPDAGAASAAATTPAVAAATPAAAASAPAKSTASVVPPSSQNLLNADGTPNLAVCAKNADGTPMRDANGALIPLDVTASDFAPPGVHPPAGADKIVNVLLTGDQEAPAGVLEGAYGKATGSGKGGKKRRPRADCVEGEECADEDAAADGEDASNESFRPAAPCHCEGGKQDIAVIKSVACTVQSIRTLLESAFKLVNRVIVLEPNKRVNCVAFSDCRCYYLCEDCGRDTAAIRRMTVQNSCARLRPFGSLEALIERIVELLRASDYFVQQQQSRNFAQRMLDGQLSAIDDKINQLLKEYRQLDKKK